MAYVHPASVCFVKSAQGGLKLIGNVWNRELYILIAHDWTVMIYNNSARVQFSGNFLGFASEITLKTERSHYYYKS